MSGQFLKEGFHFIHIPLLIYTTNPFSELGVLRRLTRIYRKNNYDLVFHYTAKPNIYGSIAARFTGTKSIAVTTGLGILRNVKFSLSKYAMRFMYRLTGLASNEVWFLNDEDATLFKKYKVCIERKIKVLQSEGVNTDEFQYNTDRKNKSGIHFLFAGRLVWSKGLKELYEAAKYFVDKGENVHFGILGFIVPNHPDFVSPQTIKEWNNEGVIKYLGETEDVRPFLENTDCMVFPSYYGEGVPRILLEAASMGVPIITTDSVGCKNVVDDYVNGFIVKTQSTRDLIKKIKMFLTMSEEDIRRMGLRGRKKVLQEFDEDIIIEEYLEAISKYIPFTPQQYKKAFKRKHKQLKSAP